MITPVMSNGIVAQTQNVNLINNGEESRGQVNYHASQTTVENQREEAHSTVVASQNSSQTNTQHDAREEGRNKYFNNRNVKKKNPMNEDGVVRKKNSGGFDMTI